MRVIHSVPVVRVELFVWNEATNSQHPLMASQREGAPPEPLVLMSRVDSEADLTDFFKTLREHEAKLQADVDAQQGQAPPPGPAANPLAGVAGVRPLAETPNGAESPEVEARVLAG